MSRFKVHQFLLIYMSINGSNHVELESEWYGRVLIECAFNLHASLCTLIFALIWDRVNLHNSCTTLDWKPSWYLSALCMKPSVYKWLSIFYYLTRFAGVKCKNPTIFEHGAGRHVEWELLVNWRRTAGIRGGLLTRLIRGQILGMNWRSHFQIHPMLKAWF